MAITKLTLTQTRRGARRWVGRRSLTAGFALVFIAAAFAGGLVAWIVKRLVSSVGLRPIDRVLGAAFGLLRGLVFVLAATVVVGMTPLKSSDVWQASVGAGLSSAALRGLKPVLPEEFGKYLP